MAIEGVESEIRVTHVELEAGSGGWIEVMLIGEFDVSTAPDLHASLVRSRSQRSV